MGAIAWGLMECAGVNSFVLEPGLRRSKEQTFILARLFTLDGI